MRYTVLIDGEAGAYGVVFPDLPGCAAMGATVDEAIANASEALRDWMETFTEDGGAPPEPRPTAAILDDAEIRADLSSGAQLASVPYIRSTGRPARANLTLDEGLLAAIDEAARRKGVTRSGMVELLAREALPALG